MRSIFFRISINLSFNKNGKIYSLITYRNAKLKNAIIGLLIFFNIFFTFMRKPKKQDIYISEAEKPVQLSFLKSASQSLRISGFPSPQFSYSFSSIITCLGSSGWHFFLNVILVFGGCRHAVMNS